MVLIALPQSSAFILFSTWSNSVVPPGFNFQSSIVSSTIITHFFSACSSKSAIIISNCWPLILRAPSIISITISIAPGINFSRVPATVLTANAPTWANVGSFSFKYSWYSWFSFKASWPAWFIWASKSFNNTLA